MDPFRGEQARQTSDRTTITDFLSCQRRWFVLASSFFEHLLCVGQACLRLIAAQHASDLCGTGVPSHLIQMRLRNVAGFLAHHVVFVGHDGDLRQVGYNDNLMRGGKIGQHTSKSTSRRAADTGIDLVEHKRIHAVCITEDNLTRQHDAAELAARGDAAQRARCEAGSAAI